MGDGKNNAHNAKQYEQILSIRFTSFDKTEAFGYGRNSRDNNKRHCHINNMQAYYDICYNRFYSIVILCVCMCGCAKTIFNYDPFQFEYVNVFNKPLFSINATVYYIH